MKLKSVLITCLLLAAACAPHMEQLGGPTAAADHPWVAALTTAQRESQAGNFETADSVLVAFRERHGSRPEAAEALYWRGFYQLDPANTSGSSARAASAFREYLESRTPIMHQAEARALLRVAARLDSLEQPLLAATTPGGAQPAARPPAQGAVARDEEVTRLRDELRRTNEELERIRRRLAAPRPEEQPAAQQPAAQQPPAQRPPR